MKYQNGGAGIPERNPEDYNQYLNRKKAEAIKENSFKTDSTNLDNATNTTMDYMRGRTKNIDKAAAAIDSMRAIDNRRSGDKEFYNRMKKK